MSTRLLSTWFDQKNCLKAKESPTTKIAENTANVSFQLAIVFTSEKGTITAVKGSMRLIMALRSDSESAVTAARVWTGVPIAPDATGPVLAIKFLVAAWNG